MIRINTRENAWKMEAAGSRKVLDDALQLHGIDLAAVSTDGKAEITAIIQSLKRVNCTDPALVDNPVDALNDRFHTAKCGSKHAEKYANSASEEMKLAFRYLTREQIEVVLAKLNAGLDSRRVDHFKSASWEEKPGKRHAIPRPLWMRSFGSTACVKKSYFRITGMM